MSGDKILSVASELISISKEVQDRVASVQPHLRSFETVVLPLARTEGWGSTVSASCYFPQYVSSNKEIRNSSIEAERKKLFYAVLKIYD